MDENSGTQIRWILIILVFVSMVGFSSSWVNIPITIVSPGMKKMVMTVSIGI